MRTLRVIVERLSLPAMCLLALSGCTEEPDIVDVVPAAEPTTSVAADPTEEVITEPTFAEPATTDPVSAPPALDEAKARAIAGDFVAALRVASESGDAAPAAAMWSGYPNVESERAAAIERLIAVHPWLLQGDLDYQVLAAWSFQPEWAMTIVAITNPERTNVTTLLLDADGVIQLIDRRASQSPPEATIVGDTLVFPGVPTEGSANAYLDGVLLGDPVVDYDEFTTTFTLPPSTGKAEVLVASFATPEFPFVTANILDRS